MTQTTKRFKAGSSVMLPSGVIQEISDIQYVHNRYQLKGISGWRYGIDQLRRVNWKAEAEKWREEALRQYPTPEAYEAACASRDKHGARRRSSEANMTEIDEVLNDILDTLYPDTPAPKEGE
ncbi:hypothetical protein [Paenibacillus donghaensis]|uniref:Uncharacterized protein n=1 Tax=Paenibacillus donghaensis TaxID=414771 RepID=A0A2Z2KVR5_9BACL|nr:hypothetical protein [Paenibacillus donghaensis]ASA25401.1 hypothetical protein B9T62_34510 [Paenibacillus donghaensis]